MKLFYKQKAVKSLICGYFLNQLCDIEWNVYRRIKPSLVFPKMGVLSHMWTKRPPIGLKCPPLNIYSNPHFSYPFQEQLITILQLSMQWVDAHEAPKPLIVPMTTFQEIQIIELHNISWILIRGALLLNYGIPWFFMHTYNRFMEVNNFIIETNNSTVQLQK